MKNRPRLLGRMRSRYPLTVIVLGVLALLTAIASGAAPSLTTATPSNTSLPSISGNAVQGQTLTAAPGAWSGDTPITFAYQWQRCNAGGSSCVSISGETGTTRLVDSGDVGSTLRVKVTATNASGSTSATSDATAVVTGGGSGAPVASAEPTISGSATQGSTLTASNGTWTGGTPITFTYQWLRCDTGGSNCNSISGETGKTRIVDSGDVGSRLRVRVTATNSSGSSSSTSNATATITGSGGGGSGAPVNTAKPTISGTAKQGQTLTASTGTWTGKTPITFADQWYRCDSNSNNCSPIGGETGPTRIVDSGDVGKRLKVRVTATNSAGANAAESATTDVVTSSGGGGGGGGGNLPPGALPLPGGKFSIPVTSVPADQRLIVDSVAFNPNPVRARNVPITITVHVVDTRGFVVRDALVFIRSVPILTSTPPELATGLNGIAVFQVIPRADFPLRNGYSVQFFVRARRTGDNPLAGVSSRRLVQVRTATG
jgi:hypothetical protein